MDNIGGRKFIAFLVCMASFIVIFGLVATRGLLTGELAQVFLFYLIAIQTLFFGGNVLEHLIAKGMKGSGTNGDSTPKQP